MPLGFIDLIEVERDSLGEVAQRLLNRAALAGHVDLKTLCHVPVLFLVYGGSEVPRCAHDPSVTP